MSAAESFACEFILFGGPSLTIVSTISFKSTGDPVYGEENYKNICPVIF